MIRIAYLGNFGPSFSTENHVALSLEELGHEVVRLQEGEVKAVEVACRTLEAEADLFLHTQTLGLAMTGGTVGERFSMLDQLRTFGIPSVGFHLDRWWGLDREDSVRTEPFFRCDLLFTADGGHEQEFAAAHVNHVWSAPAVYKAEAVRGTAREEFLSDIAFVGNWKGGYHGEANHRLALIKHLRRRWGRRVKFWPRETTIRGQDLADLYASTKVVVGDSCLLPGDRGFYWSDRVPETVGRGGVLLHPEVEGLDEQFTDGVHMVAWELGNWAELDEKIYQLLDEPSRREAIAVAGHAHVREHHTYENRLQRVLEITQDRLGAIHAESV